VTTFGFWAESLGYLVNMADPAVSLRDVRERTAQRVAELLEVFDAIVESSAAAVRDDDALSRDAGLDRAELSSMVERARAQLAEINEALERLRRGSYG
jgi:DnaK suppressor protein